jgi:hypothetical protein
MKICFAVSSADVAGEDVAAENLSLEGTSSIALCILVWPMNDATFARRNQERNGGDHQ